MNLMLAKTYNDGTDPRGWWMSEKLDGVRAFWSGTSFTTRNGNAIAAPAWFTGSLPASPLDGELWLGRGRFAEAMGIVRSKTCGEAWRGIRFMVFDAPAASGGFEDRLAAARACLASEFAGVLEHVPCGGLDHLDAELAHVVAIGGEGLMLREPGSKYEPRRSGALLKVKRCDDAEAVVIGHAPGKGRHAGRLGALLVRTAAGVEFEIGTGLDDATRNNPPKIGETVTYCFWGLTGGGVPRFASFCRPYAG